MFEAGNFRIVNIPLDEGIKPVMPVGSPLKSSEILSVVAKPVQVAVKADVSAPDAIGVPPVSVMVPLHRVCVPEWVAL